MEIIAADFPEEILLLFCFNALCHRLNLKTLRHLKDTLQNIRCAFILVSEKIHVDLHDIEIEILQRIKGAVAAAEIIEPHPIAVLMEATDMTSDHFFAVYQCRLRNLNVHFSRLHAIFSQNRVNPLVNIRYIEIMP